jgi:16S rRNA (guanine1516-N2)-methyltransferase
MPALCVFTRTDATETDKTHANQLSASLGLPLVGVDQATDYDLQLLLENSQLGLCSDGNSDRGPVIVDWTSNKAKHRLSQVSRRTEPLARALGLKSNHRPTVVDATAGLGGDSIIINALGCPVIAIERNPVVAALLGNAIERSAQRDITLLNQDASDWLAQQADSSQEIIFLDPMFGKNETRAQVKKPMQLMQQLLADQPEDSDLLSDALRVANKRVVVKRAAKAPNLNDAKPQLTVVGKAIRFDIYLCT